MSRISKIRSILMGLIELLFIFLMVKNPSGGFYIIAFILCVSLIAYAIKKLLYYFSMGIHTVGGKIHLFLGIIFLDLGMFVFYLDDIPHVYAIIYIVVYTMFSGAVDIMHAFESKKNHSRWKLKFSSGLMRIIIGILCIVFCKNSTVTVYIYAVGLLYSAIAHIIDAFRKTAIVYIQ